MSERLKSVGLDVGTTSTQMVVSELLIENRASSFAVPELEISQRKILYKGPVHFTPLLDESHVDGEKIRALVEEEYRQAGITRADVDTGAIIITGETSRKENARTVLEALSDLAGDFVAATAGPDLESVLAARGAGAVEYSERSGKTVLHMDIGGGTANLALIRDGRIAETGCLNVGGRLLKFDENGVVTYVSPVLEGLCSLRVGDRADRQQVEALAETLVQALEMAAGLRQRTGLLEKLWTKETQSHPLRGGAPEGGGGVATPQSASLTAPLEGELLVISFSGGVADCIEKEQPWLAFGDMGPVLGQAIRGSRLCRGQYRLGSETIRATVIGAGCHSAQLSGSTVFHRNIAFPMKNMPVVPLRDACGEDIRRELDKQEETSVIAIPGIPSPTYRQVVDMADQIAAGTEGHPVIVCLEQDMAKALGQALAMRLPRETPILCIDRVKVGEGSYLDIGAPVGYALPVVVKTLILNR